MDSEIYDNWLIDWLIDWKLSQTFILLRTLNQNKKSFQGFDGNLLNTYFFNIHEKFTAKQEKFMGNFAEVLAENQSKNVNIISI